MAGKGNIDNLTPFEPGQSGNPAGRPPGSKTLTTLLKEMLEGEITVEIEGEGKTKKQMREVILRRLLKAANDGEGWAIKEVFDRTDGKAQQYIEMQLPGGMESLHKHEVIFKDMTKPVKKKASPKKSTNKPTTHGRDKNTQEPTA